jgi:hypothetical protein
MRMPANRPTPLIKVIALATVLVGTLDISDALIFYTLRGVRAIQIPQSIASGILGRSSFGMGVHSALLGMVLHYFITLVVVSLYLLASHRLPLSRHPLLYGTIYGIVVYFFMNNIVLPLSRVYPPRHLSLVPFVNGLAASIFLIGIPTAVIARRSETPDGLLQ